MCYYRNLCTIETDVPRNLYTVAIERQPKFMLNVNACLTKKTVTVQESKII